VAEQPVVTSKTIKNQFHRILDQLGVRSRHQLMTQAHEFA
jgi:DNA-binding NarL/FixJ family response regulator